DVAAADRASRSFCGRNKESSGKNVARRRGFPYQPYHRFRFHIAALRFAYRGGPMTEVTLIYWRKVSQAPTARPTPAQGNALGNSAERGRALKARPIPASISQIIGRAFSPQRPLLPYSQGYLPQRAKGRSSGTPFARGWYSVAPSALHRFSNP